MRFLTDRQAWEQLFAAVRTYLGRFVHNHPYDEYHPYD